MADIKTVESVCFSLLVRYISDSAGLRSIARHAVTFLSVDQGTGAILGTDTFLNAMTVAGLDLKSADGHRNASHWLAQWLEEFEPGEVRKLQQRVRQTPFDFERTLQQRLDDGGVIRLSAELGSRLNLAKTFAERTVGRDHANLRHVLAALMAVTYFGSEPTKISSPFQKASIAERFRRQLFSEIERQPEKREDLKAWFDILITEPTPQRPERTLGAAPSAPPQRSLDPAPTPRVERLLPSAPRGKSSKQKKAPASRKKKSTVIEISPEAVIDGRQEIPVDLPPDDTGETGEPRPSRDFLAKVWNDFVDPSGDSLLDIKHEVTAFARLIAGKDTAPPLSIGIFGEWGSGKSYFMESIFAAVHKLSRSERPADREAFHEHIVQIRFNAWHYIESNLWASLVEHIFRELDSWLRVRQKDSAKLFDALTTSKQLRFEAARALVEHLAMKKKAQDLADQARIDQEAAAKADPRLSAATLWAAAVKLFQTQLTTSAKADVAKVEKDLGIADLSQNAGALADLVQETRKEANRTRILFRAMTQRLGSGRFALWAAAALVAVPLLAEGVCLLINWTFQSRGAAVIQPGLIGAASIMSTLVVCGRSLLSYGKGTLDTLESFRDALDKAVAEAAKEQNAIALEARKSLEAAGLALASAEAQLAEATRRANEAEQQFQSETAHGRLNRFIRERVEEGAYAKHLSLIATIRKDFGQLSEIMDPDDDAGVEAAELKRARTLYSEKVEKLIADNSEIVPLEIRAALRHEEDQVALRHFSRIVLYIDDLDRCPPHKVSQVLQAIHLLLFFRLFVVVVAVDARWMARSLEREFPDLLKDSADEGPRADQFMPVTAQDYIEKIFQIPLWVQRMTDESSRSFVKGLAGTRLEAAPVPAPAAGAERATPANPDAGEQEAPREAAPATGEPPPPAGASGDEISAAGRLQPAADETDEADIPFATVMFSPKEADILEDFAPLIATSPRRAKRVLNVYQVIKTGLYLAAAGGKTMWTDLSCPAILSMLAMLDGERKMEETFFDVLLEGSPRASSAEALLKQLLKAAADPHKRHIAAVMKTLVETCRKQELPADADLLLAMRTLAPIVRRYSFDCRL